MKLTSITVGNFRNLAETKIELDRLIAIVSANNYGKTNLLDAIEFGFRFIGASSRERDRMMSSISDMPLLPALSGEDYRFIVEFEDPELGDEYRCVKYGFTFSWAGDEKGALITDEMLEMRRDKSSKYTRYLCREKGEYRKTKVSPSSSKIRLAGNVLAVDVLAAIDDIDIAGVIVSVKKLNCRMCDKIDLGHSYGFRPLELYKPSTSTVFDDTDVPKTLNFLKSNYPDKYDLFIGVIHDLFPEFDRIWLERYLRGTEQGDTPEVDGKDGNTVKVPYHIKDELYQLFVKSRYINQSVGIDRMSSGTKRIIWLVANAILGGAYGYNLLGVEELETSIHPKIMKNLLESLLDCMGDSSMLVTSHSPYIIQYLAPKHVYIGVPNDDGMAVFRKIRGSKEKILTEKADASGESVADYLFDLMSDGDSASRVLTAYLEG